MHTAEAVCRLPFQGSGAVCRLLLVAGGAVALGLAGCTSKAPTHEAVACQLYPDGEPARCERVAGEMVVPRAALARVRLDSDGLGAIVAGTQIYFVNRLGKTAPALSIDNGPDYFVDGLARTVRDGKVGFVDKSLAAVIPPSWDFAFPFEDGVAAVCTGCAATTSGEHREMTGGKWGYIDRRGRVVVPVTYERGALPPANSAKSER